MIVNAKELREAVGAAKRCTTRRTTLLSHVRLDAVGQAFGLSATDMDVSYHVEIPATGNGLGSALVPASTLAEAIRGAKGSVEIEDGRIAANGAAISLVDGPPVSDYPRLASSMPGAPAVLVPAVDFKRLAAAVCPARSREESRPVLTGVLLEYADGWLTAVGCDSYRLHVHRMPAAGGDAEPWSANVPGRLVEEAAKVKRPAGAVLRIVRPTDAQCVHIGTFGEFHTGRIIDYGAYPAWRRLLPDGMAHRFDSSTGEMEPVLEAAVRFQKGGRGAANVPLRVTLDREPHYRDPRLTVEMTVQDAGTFGPAEIPLGLDAGEYWPRDALEFGVNAGFLRDACRSLDGMFTVHLRDPLRPILLTSGDEATRCLVMPIRLDS